MLAPYLKESFVKLLYDCRPEIIDMLTNIPGISAMLREQNLDIPPKLNLTSLLMEYNRIADFYEKYQMKFINEI